MERQLKIINPNIQPHEIEEIVKDSANANTPLFSANVLASTADQKKMLTNLKSRQNELTCLAESIQALQQMFLDLATLVDEQDQYVMNIGWNIEGTVTSTQKVNSELANAITTVKKIRKRRWCLCFLLLILVVVLSLVAAFYIPWSEIFPSKNSSSTSPRTTADIVAPPPVPQAIVPSPVPQGVVGTFPVVNAPVPSLTSAPVSSPVTLTFNSTTAPSPTKTPSAHRFLFF